MLHVSRTTTLGGVGGRCTEDPGGIPAATSRGGERQRVAEEEERRQRLMEEQQRQEESEQQMALIARLLEKTTLDNDRDKKPPERGAQLVRLTEKDNIETYLPAKKSYRSWP